MTTTFNPNATPFQPKSKPTVTQQPPSITPMYDPPMWNNAQQYYNFNYPAEVDEQRRYPQRALSGGIERSTHIQKNTMIKRYPTEGFNAGGRYRGRGQYPPTPVPSALPELTPFFKVPENTTPGPPPPSDDLRDAAYDSDLPPLPPTLWISGYGNETYTRYSLETMVVLFTKISRKPENIPKPDISEAAKITCLKQPDYSIALLELGALKQEEITVFDQSYFTKNSNSNTTGSNSNQVNNTQEKDNITDNSKTQKDHMKEELSSTTPSQDYHNSRNLSSPIFISRGATWPSYNMTHDTQEYENESDSGLGIPQFKTLVSPTDLQSKPIDTIDLQSKPIDIHNIFGN